MGSISLRRQGNFHPVILFKVFVIDRPVAADELGAHTGCQNHSLADAILGQADGHGDLFQVHPDKSGFGQWITL